MSAAQDERVLAHYRAQARELGAAPESTMPDQIVRERETAAILAFLEKFSAPANGSRLLEIGCGNGGLLEAISRRFGSRFELYGLDFTAELLEIAHGRGLDCDLRRGDVRCLPFENSWIDFVVSERVLINILDPDERARGFAELARVLRPEGLMVAIEGFQAGLENLNRARADFLLAPIAEPAVNNWFSEQDWQRFLASGFAELSEAECAGLAPWNFLSSHYFVTRCLHDVLKPSGAKQRNTEFAKFFAAALPPVGDYAPLRVCYLRRTAA